eukprot:XP_011620174.1 PREDICTED: sentrin-specific protease 1 [Takifugu rubripes]
MFNKIYELIETSVTNLRNDVPAAAHTEERGSLIRRKRPIESLEDGDDGDQDVLTVKKSRMGDIIGSVKTAAEGLKNRSSNVAAWVKNTMSPTLKTMLPASPGPPHGESQPSTSAAALGRRPSFHRNSLDGSFAAPFTPLTWKTFKSECLHNEKSVMGSKAYRQHVCMSQTHREVPKTNGHPVSLSTSVTPELHPKLKPPLGCSLNLRSHTTLRSGIANSSCTSKCEKTFPIKAMQSPTHGASSGHLHTSRHHSTAQESVREEEKEMYRQLLAIVSCGQSSFLRNGNSQTIVRSHRHFTSFLTTSHRLLQSSSPAASAAGETSEAPSSPTSPRDMSSQNSSNLPSPLPAYSRSGRQMWSLDTDLSPTRTSPLTPAPSPSALQDTSSENTQSSPNDGDSVIIVNVQKGEKQESSNLSFFCPEIWIKDMTSIYDCRARERRRRIEEQKDRADRLRRQRLSEEGQHGPDVEVRVRVPLEKEVPLARVREEPKVLEETPEFPDLTEEMETEVNRALKGGNCHEVLTEGFGLSLTRKDLQTLSNLNWLNDEVINFYMNLLVERSQKPNLPSVNVFNTFFYPKLRKSGYCAVRRWTKKMDIFSKDILLVPVHLGVHWCLSVVDFRKKSIMYYDSMGGKNDEACRALLEYLKEESKDKKGKEIDTSGWVLHSKERHEIPQQMNGSDCGMFTCKYAEYITKEKPIKFTQRHMPYFRKRMVWELVNRKLL